MRGRGEAGTDLSGRVAIVTGASSGIGRATAVHLAEAGAAVALVARRTDRLDALVAEITDAGGAAHAVPTDVTDRAAVSRMVGDVTGALGPVDILINNAGVMLLSPVRALRVEEWERMIEVNVLGVLYCTAAVLPGMLDRGDGHIVNVGSLAGRRPFPNGTIYSATKFAVRALSAGFRNELSPRDGIRVTDIEPGVVATELPERIADPDARRSFEERWKDRRTLDAADVARAILYAVTQPAHVNVNEIFLRPTVQDT